MNLACHIISYEAPKSLPCIDTENIKIMSFPTKRKRTDRLIYWGMWWEGRGKRGNWAAICLDFWNVHALSCVLATFYIGLCCTCGQSSSVGYVVGLVISRSLVKSPAGALRSVLGKTVYSILPQSTQLQNGYLALIRQCLQLVWYMLPAALEYPLGYWSDFRVYRPDREGRLCEYFGEYKTINRIPVPFYR